MERPIEKFLRDVKAKTDGVDSATTLIDQTDALSITSLLCDTKLMVSVMGDGSVDDAVRPRTADEKQRWLVAILAAIMALLESLTSGQSTLIHSAPASAESPTRPS